MNSIKCMLCAAMLCLLGTGYLPAQQFKLTDTSPSQALGNIYDLRNTVAATGAAGTPCGLVRFTQGTTGNIVGISLQHYNVGTGEVMNPVFNYMTSGTIFRNLRGDKFTEKVGSYFVTGTVDDVEIPGTVKSRIFLLKVNAGTGTITTSRYLKLPDNMGKIIVSNIIAVGDFLYVSGSLVHQNRRHIFAFKSNVNLGPLAWFQLYPLSDRNFRTFAECLTNDRDTLVLGGVDESNARAVVFKVNPANGMVVGTTTAFSLCTSSTNCLPINRVSLGMTGGFKDLVVQTKLDPNNGVRFNISALSANWTTAISGTTYSYRKWDLKSVRFENGNVLLSHFDNANLNPSLHVYNRGLYNASSGALLPNTLFTYTPPGLDVTGVARQIETIMLTTPSKPVFSVGKYRNTADADINYLAELEPSKTGCQRPILPQQVTGKLQRREERIRPLIFQFPVIDLPIQRVELPTKPTKICDAGLPSTEEEEANKQD